MKKRFITVPLNREGEDEYTYGVEQSDNLVTYELPETEFETLDDSGIFVNVNNKFNLLIDDYESEIIPQKALSFIISELDKDKIDTPVFFKAVRLAKDIKTFVGLDF